MKKNYWFTSDLHLSHRNIIKYCNRPFKDADEMNEAIINNWNSVVHQHDDIYVLGDVAFEKDREKLKWILSRLKGNKFIVWGNHDRGFKETIMEAGWHDCGELHTVTIPLGGDNLTQRIVLCHYAMRVWDQSHYGVWHLYGHSHGSLPDDPHSRSCDVGVDSWNFTPVSMAQLGEHMSKKKFKPIDHHEGREYSRKS